MSLLGRLFALYPFAWSVATFGSAAAALWLRDVRLALAAAALGWLVPVATFRLLVAVAPMPKGLTPLDGGQFSSWWAGHNLQVGYDVFPFFENAIKLWPGAYSVWLRAWGSRIGSNVYWAQSVRVLDRSMLDVGDGCVFGHETQLVAHIIFPRQGRVMLYLNPIRIGAGSLVGAYCVIGAAAELGQKVLVGARAALGAMRIEDGGKVATGATLVGDWRALT